MLKKSKSFFLLFILLFFINGLIAQTTAIPDLVFEEALIELGLDSGIPDGLVLTANVKEETRLDLRGFGTHGNEIMDLTGIEDFAKLEYLNFDFHEVNQVNLSENVLLVELSAHGNKLTNLSLLQNTKLKKIVCEYNQLVNLDLTNNPDLEVLRCGGNKLLNLDISGNVKLEQLDCHKNELTEIDLSKNIELVSLHCITNQFSELDFSKNINLESLNCSYNPLSTIDVSQNQLLTFFAAEFTEITELDVSQNEELEILYCDNNKLSIIKFSENPSLKALYCSGNQLTDLDLSKCTFLFRLYCRNNALLCLNVKNGNNHQFSDFSSKFNPLLTCIEVDDAAFSTSNWLDVDLGVAFRQFCGHACDVRTTDFAEEIQAEIFPNPSKKNITITYGEKIEGGHLILYNSIGQKVLSQSFESNATLNLELPQEQSIYLLQLKTLGGATKVFKILKE